MCYGFCTICFVCFAAGVQQYLYKRGRADNIFTDTIYEQFSDILNDVMQRYEIRLNLAGG